MITACICVLILVLVIRGATVNVPTELLMITGAIDGAIIVSIAYIVTH